MAAIPPGMMVSPKELERREEERVGEARGEAPKLPALIAELQRRWQLAYQAKWLNVDPELMKDSRQRNGEYEPDLLAKIKTSGGSQIFDNVTETQCGNAEAAIADVLLFHDEDRCWGLDAPPLPDLPEDAIAQVAGELVAWAQRHVAEQGAPPGTADVAEMAKQLEEELKDRLSEQAETRTRRMEDKIARLFDMGGFRQAMYDFLSDFLTFKAAFLRGPVLRMITKPTWVRGPDGRTRLDVKRDLVLSIERVDPRDAFPDPGSIEINDGGFRIRRLLLRQQVEELRGAPGSLDKQIDAVLARMDNHSAGGIRTWMPSDAPRALLEQKVDATRAYINRHEAVEGWEYFTGAEIEAFYREIGETPPAGFEPGRSYRMWCLWCGEWLLKLARHWDPAGNVPVFKTCFKKMPGAFWGKSLPECIRSDQDAINSLSRASLTNAGFAARPNKMVDKDRIVPGYEVTSCVPGEVIVTQNNQNHTIRPVEYFMPPLVADRLMELRNAREAKIFDKTGFQPWNLGDGRGEQGAGRTLGGFSILVGMQNKTAKKAIFHVDQDVVRPLVLQFWTWLMLYDPDESIKGDVAVVARGAFALFVRETEAERRMRWLEVTNNPVDMQIIGLDGRAEALRKTAQVLRVGDGGVPDEEEMARRVQGGLSMGSTGSTSSPQAGSGQAGAPAAGAAPAGERPTAAAPTNADLIAASLAAAQQKKMQAEADLAEARAAALDTERVVKKAMAVMRLQQLSAGGPAGGLR